VHHQTLPFYVRIVRTPIDLSAACRVRADSYGHHVEAFRDSLLEPDLLDADDHTTVVLAVDKVTRKPVGTARFQTNHGAQPLLIEHSVSMPQSMQADTRAEITRLAVIAGADPLVKICLMKASYLFCLAAQVRWMVIGARSPALVRQYRALGFDDVFAKDFKVPLKHAGDIDHSILAFNVTAAEESWRVGGHRLYTFMVETAHPDIQLFSKQPSLELEPA